MRFVVEPDVETFAERALPWLLRDPITNNVAATITMVRRNGQVVEEEEEPTLWVLVEDDEEVVGAAIRTPGWALLLPALSVEAARGLADFLADRAISLPGVTGPDDAARAFGQRWGARTGCRMSVVRRVRLHRLGVLVPPTGVDGALRPATPDDADLCQAWVVAFTVEIGGGQPLPRADTTAAAISAGRYWLWESRGTPVSLVGHAPPAARVARIGPVYTPPAHREHGYASAATAELSRRLLDREDVDAVILYTDLANPTSNVIYHRIGYRPVTDAVELVFTEPDPASRVFAGETGTAKH